MSEFRCELTDGIDPPHVAQAMLNLSCLFGTQPIGLLLLLLLLLLVTLVQCSSFDSSDGHTHTSQLHTKWHMMSIVTQGNALYCYTL